MDDEADISGLIGGDEEGIFNFLSEVIGQDVESEMLKEFSNSDEFADLVDVVTASLNPASTASSRRGSKDSDLILAEAPKNSTELAADKDDNPEEVEQEPQYFGIAVDENATKSANDVSDTLEREPEVSKKEDEKVPEDAKELNKCSDLAAKLKLKLEEKLKTMRLRNKSETKSKEDSKFQKTTSNQHVTKSLDKENLLPSGSNAVTNVQSTSTINYDALYDLKACSVLLLNLVSLQNVFPKGLKSPMRVTESQIRSVHEIEQRRRSARACKKLTSHRKPVLLDESELESSKRIQEKSSRPRLPSSSSSVEELPMEPESRDETRKSPSVEKTLPKKKQVIESSSEDEKREPKKVQFETKRNEENVRKDKVSEVKASTTRILPFERKRDQVDVKDRKFDKFENERQRKLGERKREKEKVQEVNILDDIVKDKTLSTSFRIPKKSSANKRPSFNDNVLSTPLAVADVPKENLQFERFRKGKEKDSNDFRYPKPDRIKKEPEVYERFKDDNRLVLLAPEAPEDNKPNTPDYEWEDEKEDSIVEVEQEKEKEKSIIVEDKPVETEGPLSDIQVTPFAVGVTTLVNDNPNVELPDTEQVTDIAEVAAMKLAWWFSKARLTEVRFEDLKLTDAKKNDSDSECSSFAGNVSNPDDDEYQNAEVGEGRCTDDPVNEYCGRSLLQAKIRSGTGESFLDVFEVRFGASYEKENFQAKCNLCKSLVVGKKNLATHVRGEEHVKNLSSYEPKMEKTSDSKSVPENELKDDKSTDETKSDKKESVIKESRAATNVKEKSECNKDVTKTEKEKDSNDKKSEEKKDRTRRRSSERHHSKDDEVGRTSTGLEIRIPAGAIPAKKESRSRRSRSKSRSRRSTSRSRRRRSKSRSPRRHRSKSRSPRRRSRSPRRRRRSRSRTPIQRIPRSPTKVKESKEQKRRSPSAERDRAVEEFLAKTNRRRSRTPPGSRAQKRRRTRSRSKSPKIVFEKDNEEFKEKMVLQFEGKWTKDMDARWMLMDAEIAMFTEQFMEKKKLLSEVPEKHSQYAEEWKQFWERRYQEVEKEGKNPETYDYVSEWKEFWTKRLVLLLQAEADTAIKDIKLRHGMDLDSLRKVRMGEPKSTIKSEPITAPEPSVIVADPSFGSLAPNEKSFSRTRLNQQQNVSSVDKIVKKEPDVKVTVEDIKNKWATLTGQSCVSNVESRPSTSNAQPAQQKTADISCDKSDIGSSIASDFDGFDLVQVLQLVAKMEDQLSFLADKVKEYFKLAEEMELKKRKKSHELLV